MSGSGKGLLGMWLYRRGKEWAIKEGSPIHKARDIPLVEKQAGDNDDNGDNKNSVVFSLKNQVGGLARALQVFQVSYVLGLDRSIELGYINPPPSANCGGMADEPPWTYAWRLALPFQFLPEYQPQRVPV